MTGIRDNEAAANAISAVLVSLKAPRDSPFHLRPVVIGISGATNAGKTTIANRLLSEFPGSDIIHQDDFFRDPNDPNHEHVTALNHNNWDTFSAIHVDSLIETVRQKIVALTILKPEQPERDSHTAPSTRMSFLILEGILVLNIPELFDMMDKRYYITLTNEECQRRRLTRNYDPPDVPGYFDKIVWPMYLKYSTELEKRTEEASKIEYLSGLTTKEESYSRILSDLRSLIPWCSIKEVDHLTQKNERISSNGH